MTYIKLEDAMMLVQKMMKDNSNQWKEWETIHNARILEKVLCKITSLPSINPESIIEEMIEENRDEVYMEGKETTRTEIEYELLQELIQKFKS